MRSTARRCAIAIALLGTALGPASLGSPASGQEPEAAAPPAHHAEDEERVAKVAEARRELEVCRVVEARALAEELVSSNPDDSAARALLGESHLAVDDFDPAIEHLERALELDPTNPELALTLGEAYGRKARQAGLLSQVSLAKKAREGFERAVGLDPDHLGARRNLVEFYSRAPAMMGGGKDKAREQIAAIEERDPARGREARALYQRLEKESEEAIESYRAAIEEAPELALAHLELASLLAEIGGHREAADTLLKLLEREPDNKLALYRLGEVAAKGKLELDRGARALEKYLERAVCHEDPSHVEAWLELAKIREHQGDHKAAAAAYRSALELDPEESRAKKALRQTNRRDGG